MRKLKASDLDPHREELLFPFMLLMLIPIGIIWSAVWVIRFLTKPFIDWGK